jgi:hypothetical protein
MSGFESPISKRRSSRGTQPTQKVVQQPPQMRTFEVPDVDMSDFEPDEELLETPEQTEAREAAKDTRRQRKMLSPEAKSRLEVILGLKKNTKDIKIGDLELNIKLISSDEDEQATFIAYKLINEMIAEEKQADQDLLEAGNEIDPSPWYLNSELVDIKWKNVRSLAVLARSINTINGKQVKDLAGSDDLVDRINLVRELDALMSNLFLSTLVAQYNAFTVETRQRYEPTTDSELTADVKKA